ncbi:hypothetical protein [Natrinema salinisoli]|uniref:hypothetical protein n=1 Tax=Natrinema salinisoli TaxID=2878535 RepID=UPI001CF02A75|nr:hypothetical protein [Natrinema salinisoli]
MPSQKPSRRSVLKTIGGTAAVASAAGLGSAETRQATTETPSEPPYDFEYRTVGDDVRDAVGHLWWLLSVDRDRIDELLEKSPASTKATRRKQEAVDELRSTYEVEIERDERNERELTYHLVDPTVRPLHETETGLDTMAMDESNSGKDAAESVAESVSVGLQQEAEPRIQPMHSGTIHRKMAAAAVQGTDHESATDTLKDESVRPDQWDQKCQVCSSDWLSLGDRFDLVNVSPDAVEEEVRKAIRDIDDSASPHHMYVPGGEEFQVDGLLSVVLPPGISLLQVEVTGAAPQDAQAHWEDATSQYYTDYYELGRAFHFLQDMSQPLHTGAIGPQVLNTQGTIHHAYKRFIDDNWENADDTSIDLVEEFNRGTESPQWEGSMEETCETLADWTSAYSEQVYETIVDNGPNNRNDWDDYVKDTAYGCMWYIGSFSRGAINQL